MRNRLLLLSFVALLAVPSTVFADAAVSDFNSDGMVDFEDFLLFASAFGSTNATYDLTGDGSVDFEDFLQFASVFGQSTAGSGASGLSATAQGATSIALTWQGVDGASVYRVEWRIQGAGDFQTGQTVSGTSATTTGLIPGVTYSYRVVATSGSGDLTPSNVATATTTASGTPSGNPVTLSGTISSDMTLTRNNTYLLMDAVFVADGATLSIEPGTTIFGEGTSNGTLIISQGGKIIAPGTKDRPIVFTSDKEESERDRADWGGLIINGRAPLNTGATALGEGDTGAYGGTDPADNSGVLRYIRVEFAGIEFSADNELNGIAFQGVGSGTFVDYVQVHFNQDDGIEFFGGTVNAKHLLCTGIRDDSFDWTDGWTGKGQFWIAQQRGDDADNGFEADNDGDNNEATPRSNPTIYNVTLIGDPNGPESDTGMLLREGTAATIRNAVVIGFNQGGLDIDNGSTFSQATAGDLSVQNSIFFNNRVGGSEGASNNFVSDSDDGFNVADWARTSSYNNRETDPQLRAPFSLRSPDFRPFSSSPAAEGAATPPTDGFFESVSYVGAVSPGSDWTEGWITTEQPAGSVVEPATPANLTASAQNGTSISLSWSEAEGAASYTVERKFAAFGAYEEVVTDLAATSYMEMNLIPGVSYSYRVKAVNSAGTSPASTAASAATTASGMPSGNPMTLSGTISSDMTLTRNNTYLLEDAVFVADGATLSIEPGTTIYGEGTSNGTLIISQGGKIIAPGTKDQPIVFTSDKFEGQRDRADWGGLIINGRAPLNTGTTALGEGDTGQYGGSDPADNSGVLRYVRVEFAGIEFSADNELNGIAFQGVGSGTFVDYVQVHFNQDDGIEFFGGTVNAKHLLCTGIRDDSFDWTDGWTGMGQFWIAQQRGDDADNGFEADNDGDNNEATPRSNPTIYNVTLIGDPNGPESDTGMLLREGTAATIRNAIVLGFNQGGLDIDNGSTFSQATAEDLSVQNSIFYNNRVGGFEGSSSNFVSDSDDGFDVAAWVRTSSYENSESDPMLIAPYSLRSPDFRPGMASPATNGSVAVAAPPSDGFFDTVDFIGGVDPEEDWTAGWTTTEQPAGTEETPENLQILEGNITSNTTLSSDNVYLLRDAVFVQNGATLTIEAGTTIFGEGTSNGTLIISQGGKIMAEGTRTAPIVFTSDKAEGQRDRGDWGGLIINGRAPLNTGDSALGEGDTGAYGGSDPADNSGVLRYVRVEFAGIEFSADNELNGIAFQGVGSGTTVEHVQVHYNQDDGIEFFGGTVNARYLMCTGIRDDSFDWTDGWTGKGQFWVAQQRGDDADNGFEADNDGDNNEATPRSNPTIYNVTLIGDPNGPESDTGLLIREGTAGDLANFIVMGFNQGGLDIDNGSTFSQATAGELTLKSTIFHNNRVGGFEGTSSNFVADSDDGFNVADWARTAASNNAETDPILVAPFSLLSPDFRPSTSSPAANGSVTVTAPPADGFFTSVDFIGGVDPDNDWTTGWTTTELPGGQ